MRFSPWPSNETEDDVDLVLIETSLLLYVNDAVIMLIIRNYLYKKAVMFLSKLSFKGQETYHTIVKWSVAHNKY